jgi:hypothetical protein
LDRASRGSGGRDDAAAPQSIHSFTTLFSPLGFCLRGPCGTMITVDSSRWRWFSRRAQKIPVEKLALVATNVVKLTKVFIPQVIRSRDSPSVRLFILSRSP